MLYNFFQLKPHKLKRKIYNEAGAVLSRDKGTSCQWHCAGHTRPSGQRMLSWSHSAVAKHLWGLCVTEMVRGTFDFSTGKGHPTPLLPPLPGGEVGPVLELHPLVASPSIEWILQELGISPLSGLRAHWYNKNSVFGL